MPDQRKLELLGLITWCLLTVVAFCYIFSVPKW